MAVYFAQVGQYVKVGYSQNPERRVRNLFSSATPKPKDCPTDRASRRLLKVIPGGMNDEHLMHAALDDYRADVGEFFIGEQPVYDFIKAVEPGVRYEALVRDGGPFWTINDTTPKTPEEWAAWHRFCDAFAAAMGKTPTH